MIVTVTLNAALDHVIVVDGLKLHDTNRTKLFQTDAGGKGINVSRVLTQLETDSIATGLLGGTSGAAISSILRQESVRHAFANTALPTRTNINIESGEGAPTTLNAAGPQISQTELQALFAKCETLFDHAAWVVLGGSLPPGIPTDVYGQLGALALSHGCRWVLDADGDPMVEGLKGRPHVIKPNVMEASRLVGRELVTDEDVALAAKSLLATMSEDDPAVIISQGAGGAVLVSPSGAWKGQPIPIDERSSVGAGDSMVAGFLAARTSGKDWPDALKLGLAAGAATAETDGTGIGTAEQINRLLPLAVVRPIDFQDW